MDAARQRGLAVGETLAVAGFDDIPAARVADPPLTTVRQPIDVIGRELVDMLVRLMRNEPVDTAPILLKPELMIRASSGKPR